MPRRKVTSRDSPGASRSGIWIAAQGSSATPLRPDRCARRKAAGRRSEPLRPMNSVRSQVSVANRRSLSSTSKKPTQSPKSLL